MTPEPMCTTCDSESTNTADHKSCSNKFEINEDDLEISRIRNLSQHRNSAEQTSFKNVFSWILLLLSSALPNGQAVPYVNQKISSAGSLFRRKSSGGQSQWLCTANLRCAWINYAQQRSWNAIDKISKWFAWLITFSLIRRHYDNRRINSAQNSFFRRSRSRN